MGFKNIAFFMAALGWPFAPADAGESFGVPQNITIQAGRAMFTTSGGHSGAPGCATTARWAIDARDAAGQAMLAVLLSAHAQQKAIRVYGIGTCVAWGDSENVEYLVSP